MTVTGQRLLDFDAADRREQQRAALDRHLESLGLTTAERRIVAFLWTHPAAVLADNQTAVRVSQTAISRAIGYSKRWTQTSLDDLETFGVVQTAVVKRGTAKAYLIDWRTIRTMRPARAADIGDPFAAFQTDTAGTDAVTSEVTSEVTGAETDAVTGATTGAVTGAPQTQNLKTYKPQTLNNNSNEGGRAWNRAVDPNELRSWPGRRALWKRACQINSEIDPTDRDDVVGFVAAILCCLRPQVENPAGMLLSFVRRRAWRYRGRGGIDGHWISKATTELRELERERLYQPEPVGG